MSHKHRPTGMPHIRAGAATEQAIRAVEPLQTGVLQRIVGVQEETGADVDEAGEGEAEEGTGMATVDIAPTRISTGHTHRQERCPSKQKIFWTNTNEEYAPLQLLSNSK